WSRAVLAKIAAELKFAGASIIVYDFPLDTPETGTPVQLASLIGGVDPPPPAGMTRADQVFAESLGRSRSVTGFMLGNAGSLPQLKSAVAAAGAPDPFAMSPAFQDASGALPAFESTSAGIGALNLLTDADGHLRTLPLVFRLNGRPVPSLEAEAMRLASGRP